MEVEPVPMDEGRHEGQEAEGEHRRSGHPGSRPDAFPGAQKLEKEAGQVSRAEERRGEPRVDGPGEGPIGVVGQHVQLRADDQHQCTRDVQQPPQPRPQEPDLAFLHDREVRLGLGRHRSPPGSTDRRVGRAYDMQREP